MKFLLLKILVLGSLTGFSQENRDQAEINKRVLNTLYQSKATFVNMREQASNEIKRINKQIKELERTSRLLEVTGNIQRIDFKFSAVTLDSIFSQCVQFLVENRSSLRNVLPELSHELFVDRMEIYVNETRVRSLMTGWSYGKTPTGICTNLKRSVEAYSQQNH